MNTELIRVQEGGAEWEEVRSIRYRVFVEEQAVDEAEEYDEFEGSSVHYLLRAGGQPAGVCRWRQTELGFKLERFAVLPSFRGKGLGIMLVQACLRDVAGRAGESGLPVYLHAQVQAIPFYERCGFQAGGSEFSEAGIRHRKMKFVPGTLPDPETA